MSIEVEIKLNRKNYLDFFLFNTYVKAGSLFVNFLVWFCVIFMCLIVFFTDFCKTIWPYSYSWVEFYVIVVVTISIALFCFPLIILPIKANNYVKNKLNAVKYTFNKDDFCTEDRFKKYEYKPTAILEAADTKNYVFLYMAKNTAWILPKKQLDKNAYNDIINFLNNNRIGIKKYSYY